MAIRGANTAGGFNHRRHDAAKLQLAEFSQLQSTKRERRSELRGGGFNVSCTQGAVVQIIFVWAESAAQARFKARQYCTLQGEFTAAARPLGMVEAHRPQGIVPTN